MPYIAPNSDVRLLRNVPIDIDYVHTLWFFTAEAQANYFISKNALYLTQQYYVRKGRGRIKIQASADSIYDCNYMMFRNTSFNNKWFYAFITDIEYLNNNTAMISFQIDLLQTWFFEMNLKQCYIERQHSTTDIPGDNLIPEGLETGDYVYIDNNLDWSYNFNLYDVVVYTTFTSSLSPGGQWTFGTGGGEYRWGIYTGLNIRVFRNIDSANTVSEINSFINAAISRFGADTGIIAMIMIPHDSLDSNLDPAQISHSIPKITRIDTYYNPRNKKLLTYPYAFIEGQNCEGATAIFKQEYFGGQNPYACQFMVTFNITCAPVALCVPIWYKSSEYNYSEAMYINNFVQCSYNTDLFKAYLAQSLTATLANKLVDDINNPPAINNVTHDLNHVFENLIKPAFNKVESTPPEYKSYSDTAITQNIFTELTAKGLRETPGLMALPLAAAGTMVAGAGVGAEIYNSMASLYSKAIAAPHNNGANTPDYLTSNRLKGFWFFHRTIRTEYAEKIDKYFDMFGYAMHTVAVPNIHARERWTYIKTIGCQVDGNIPTEAVSAIQSIFNKGITFWADAEHFGDYTQTNWILA